MDEGRRGAGFGYFRDHRGGDISTETQSSSLPGYDQPMGTGFPKRFHVLPGIGAFPVRLPGAGFQLLDCDPPGCVSYLFHLQFLHRATLSSDFARWVLCRGAPSGACLFCLDSLPT